MNIINSIIFNAVTWINLSGNFENINNMFSFKFNNIWCVSTLIFFLFKCHNNLLLAQPHALFLLDGIQGTNPLKIKTLLKSMT